MKIDSLSVFTLNDNRFHWAWNKTSRNILKVISVSFVLLNQKWNGTLLVSLHSGKSQRVQVRFDIRWEKP